MKRKHWIVLFQDGRNLYFGTFTLVEDDIGDELEFRDNLQFHFSERVDLDNPADHNIQVMEYYFKEESEVLVIHDYVEINPDR